MTGFVNIPLHPSTAEDAVDDKWAVFDGPEKSAGTSSFAAKQEKDDVVAVRRDFILKRDFSGMLSVISAMREERGVGTFVIEGEEPVSVGFEVASLPGCAEKFQWVLFITSDGTTPLSLSVRSTESVVPFATEETSRTTNFAEERSRLLFATLRDGTGAVFVGMNGGSSPTSFSGRDCAPFDINGHNTRTSFVGLSGGSSPTSFAGRGCVVCSDDVAVSSPMA